MRELGGARPRQANAGRRVVAAGRHRRRLAAPRPGRPRSSEIADGLGRRARLRRRGQPAAEGYRAELTFASADEALDLVRRLRSGPRLTLGALDIAHRRAISSVG